MIGIPYVHGPSEKLQHIFKGHGLNMYHKPTNKLRNILVHPKDPTPNKNVESYTSSHATKTLLTDTLVKSRGLEQNALKNTRTRTNQRRWENIARIQGITSP